MAGKTVLCISDEESLLDRRKQELESSGFKVLTASNGKNALATLASHSVDAVVLDCAILDGDCGALPALIKQAKPRIPVILLGAKPPATQVAFAAVDVFISKQENDHQLLLSRLDSLIRLRGHSHSELEQKYVVFADTAHRYQDCSDGVCELLGYPRMDLMGMTIEDVSYVPERVSGLFERFVTRGELGGDYMLRHKTGRPLFIHYRSYVFSDGCIAAVWEPITGWRELYSTALVEADFTKLRERIDAAELAIQERVQELREDGNAREERQALQDALAGLKILRRELAE